MAAYWLYRMLALREPIVRAASAAVQASAGA
jgi:hypothetical protein